MKNRRFVRRRLWVEELEPRVVLSSSAIAPAIFQAVATTSANWSGYAAETNLKHPQTGSVTAVNGSWIVPTVTGSGDAYSSMWVGIDGYASSTVEQIGTDSDLVGGVATYYAWFEMYPSASITVTSLTIKPGDKITASVTAATPNFTLSLTDVTTGLSFSTTQTAARAKRSSAEWVMEAPSSGNGILPLANFGTASFTAASATINGATGPIDNATWQNASINMVAHRVTKATTSALTDTTAAPITSSFSVTYVAPTIVVPPPQPSGRHHHWWWQNNIPGAPDDANPDAQTVALNPQVGTQFDFNRSRFLPGAEASFDAANPVFSNRPATFSTQAIQQNALIPAFIQGGISADANLGSEADPGIEVAPPIQRLHMQPAPALQQAPNRAVPSAIPMSDLSASIETSAAIFEVAPSTPEVPAEHREARPGGLLKAFVSVLGIVGAFTLFNGGLLTRSRTSDEREQFERDRLQSR